MHVWRKGNIAIILGDFFERASTDGSGSTIAEDLFNSNSIVGLLAVSDIFDDEFFSSMKFAAIHNVVNLFVVSLKDD